MNKTKIVATIGPATKDPKTLEQLINNGVDVIRLNMAHSDYEFCTEVIDDLDTINKKLNTAVSVLLDLEGPGIRTGKFSNGKAKFHEGDRIRMYTDGRTGNSVGFSVNYSNIIHDLKYRSIIKLSMGQVILEVVEKAENYAVCEVIIGGTVESLSEVHLPGIKLQRKFLTNQDKEDILFANKVGADFISVSNVTSAEDVLEINDLLIELGNDHIGLLAKIQNEEAVNNLNSIIEVSDGVILARSDLAIELPIETVPNIKNRCINKCAEKSKISIITAELDSFLTKEILPNRSEVSDLANAVSRCVDAILLTGETSVGAHPIEAVQQLENVIKEAEKEIDYDYFFNQALKIKNKNITSTVASVVALGAIEINAQAIIIVTNSGYTAKRMSRLKPPCVILAAVPNLKAAKSLNLHFGVEPILVEEYDFDAIAGESIVVAKKLLDLKSGDKVIITGGYPFKEVNHTNFMKIEEI